MTMEHSKVWSGLPESLQDKLLDDPHAKLTADDVTALVHNGQPVASAYFVESTDGPADGWRTSNSFIEYIERLRNERP